MAGKKRRPPPRPRTPTPAFEDHAFEPDPDGGTGHDGRQICGACYKPGRAGDVQHPHGAPPLRRFPPVPDEARRLDARMLGEAPR